MFILHKTLYCDPSSELSHHRAPYMRVTFLQLPISQNQSKAQTIDTSKYTLWSGKNYFEIAVVLDNKS